VAIGLGNQNSKSTFRKCVLRGSTPLHSVSCQCLVVLSSLLKTQFPADPCTLLPATDYRQTYRSVGSGYFLYTLQIHRFNSKTKVMQVSLSSHKLLPASLKRF